jgi:hypothetical protein
MYWASLFMHRGVVGATCAGSAWQAGPQLSCSARQVPAGGALYGLCASLKAPSQAQLAAPFLIEHARVPPAACTCAAGALYMLGADDSYSWRNGVSIARSSDGGFTWNRSTVMQPPPGCQFGTGE